MKIFNLFIFALTLSMVQSTSASTTITNGENATLKEFPWQASLQQHRRHFCGGSIISSRFIITAAHCLNSVHPGDMDVWAGGTGSKTDLKKLPSIKVFHIHADYNNWRGSIKYADIALIELTSDIEFNETVKAIDLPGKDITTDVPSDVSKSISTSGWGLDENNQSPVQLKKLGDLIVIPQTESTYWNSVEHLELIKDSNYNSSSYNIFKTFQTGHYVGIQVKDEKSFCRGDSGGPMIQMVDDRPVLIGAGSHLSHGACTETKVFYYANVFRFLDWIKEVTRI